MDYEKCFVLDAPEERPKTKRKTDGKGLQSSWEQRRQLFHNLWTQQERRITDILHKSNQETLRDILEFVDKESNDRAAPIPTGIISGGPDLSFQESLFKQLAEKLQTSRGQVCFVSLSSKDASNLKNLLKVLIQRATSQNEGTEDHDDELTSRRKGLRLLNYDLEILRDWSVEHRVAKYVVAFQNSEAFDTALLAEVIDLFRASPVSIVLLFGISTSVENFQDRLPRAAIRNVKGQRFDAVQARDVLEQVFEATIDDPGQRLWIGPGLCRMLLDRQNDHFQSVQAFIDSLKYAYMSHIYANPLSLLLKTGLTIKAVPKDHLDAARNLQSFRRYAEGMLDEGKTDALRSLLDSEQEFLKSIQRHLSSGRDKMMGIVRTLKIVCKLRTHLQPSSDISPSNLYVKAMSGDFNQSPLVRELLLSVKKAQSDVLAKVLDDLKTFDEDEIAETAKQLRARLDALIANNKQADGPLRSEHDIRHETLRTTVVAQKVELSKQKSKITKIDSEYSQIVQDLHGTLEGHFKATLVDPKDLFMHEVFMYDIKGPHRDSFTPRPRSVIERALSAPHDYLNCNCCRSTREQDEPILLPSNPPASILYQLYLESGALINVSDLFSAFNAIVSKEDDSEKRTMALFQRALGELKYMGFIKPSRKKLDHVAKLAWKGL
ncbi:MAG: hypothetical protein M1821_008644 [Bathelium mastoideum]|nr:MAG: hypothetical protein M1821_008644 [Bathelium mastoideum]